MSAGLKSKISMKREAYQNIEEKVSKTSSITVFL
jgi:hypothetical protein